MSESLDNVLNAARQLTPQQQRQLAEELMNSIADESPSKNGEEEALAAVERTHGAVKGLDRETIKWLAEDEELCGY